MYKITDSNGIERTFTLGEKGSKNIFVSENNETPAFLSKYHRISEYSINNLIKGQIYVAAYNEMNDIFESLYKRIKLDKIQFEEIYEMLKRIGGTTSSIEVNREMYHSNPEIYFDVFIKSFTEYLNLLVGIFCTTTENDNDLMWAHYSENEGFVIEYDSQRLNTFLNTPHKVLYLENGNFDLKPTTKEFSITLFINLLIKKACWRYENEYRYLYLNLGDPFINKKPFSIESYIEDGPRLNRTICIDIKCISKIILGFHFFLGYAIKNEEPFEFYFGKDEKGILKSKLLNYSIESNFKLMVIVIESNTYELKPVEITVRIIGEHTFLVEKWPC